MYYIIHLLHYVMSLLQAHAPLDTIYFINVQDISVENLAQLGLVETDYLVIAKTVIYINRLECRLHMLHENNGLTL